MKNAAAHVVPRHGGKRIGRAGKGCHCRNAAAPAPQEARLKICQCSAALRAAVHLVIPLTRQSKQPLQKYLGIPKNFRLSATFQPGGRRQRRHRNLGAKARRRAERQGFLQPLQGEAAPLRLPALPAAALQPDKIHPRRLHGRQILPDLLRCNTVYIICRTEKQSGMFHMLSSRICALLAFQEALSAAGCPRRAIAGQIRVFLEFRATF